MPGRGQCDCPHCAEERLNQRGRRCPRPDVVLDAKRDRHTGSLGLVRVRRRRDGYRLAIGYARWRLILVGRDSRARIVRRFANDKSAQVGILAPRYRLIRGARDQRLQGSGLVCLKIIRRSAERNAHLACGALLAVERAASQAEQHGKGERIKDPLKTHD